MKANLMLNMQNNCWSSYSGEILINLNGVAGADPELVRTLGFVCVFVLGNENMGWEH